MGEITVGQQIRITEPLTVTKIGTCDLEVEYPAGSINRKLYIPKNICEGVVLTRVIIGGASNIRQGAGQITSGTVNIKVWTCEVCGKVCKAKIGLAGHMRSHAAKRT